MKRLLLIGWLASFGAAAQFNQVELCDKAIAGRCATVDASGNLGVNATVNVAGAADLPGNTATFNANNVCTSVLTAGEQSVGFHLDSGTLTATLTAFGTQAIGAVNCASAGTCTALTFSSGSTIVVTNPNGVKDVGVVAQPGMRQVQVCTGSSGTTGSATGVVTATYLNATSSGGGGGNVNVNQLNGNTTDTNSGAKSAGTLRVVLATDQPALTNKLLVTPDSVALPANQSVNLAQVAGATTVTGHGTASGAQRVELPTDGTGAVGINGTVNVQGLGTAGAPSGGVQTMQGSASGTPLPVSGTVTANAADNFAAATLLNSACTVATACTSSQSIQWATNGVQSAELTVTAISSPVGITVACDKSYDGGTTYTLASCFFWNGTARKSTLANADLAVAGQWAMYWTGAPSNVRARLATFTSGSATFAGRSTFSPGLPFPVEAKPPTQATVTLTASTSETTLLAAVAGTFLDLTYLKCSNTSTTASAISIRDATAGTVRDTLVCPAAIGPCEGNVYRVPFAQTTSNANWTIQAGTSASSLICTAQAVPR